MKGACGRHLKTLPMRCERNSSATYGSFCLQNTSLWFVTTYIRLYLPFVVFVLKQRGNQTDHQDWSIQGYTHFGLLKTLKLVIECHERGRRRGRESGDSAGIARIAVFPCPDNRHRGDKGGMRFPISDAKFPLFPISRASENFFPISDI